MGNDEELRNRFRSRDYTREPIRSRQAHPSPLVLTPKPQSVVPPEAPQHFPAPTPVYRKKRTFKKFILFTLLALAVGAGLGGWFYINKRPASPITTDIQNKAAFSIYYPTKMPAGFSLNSNSANYTKGLLTFDVAYGNKKLIFSEQARPPQPFNLDDFNRQQVKNHQNISTPAGNGVIGTFNDNLIVSIGSADTWIIINSPQGGIKAGELEIIAKGLTLAQ